MRFGQPLKFIKPVAMRLSTHRAEVNKLFQQKFHTKIILIKQSGGGYYQDQEVNRLEVVLPVGYLGALSSVYINSESSKIDILVPDPVNNEFLHGIKVTLNNFEDFTFDISPEEKDRMREAVSKLIIKRNSDKNPLDIAMKIHDTIGEIHDVS